MRIRCYHCGAWQDYRPRNFKLPKWAQKKCINCGKKFKIRENDINTIETEEENIPKLMDVKMDKRLPLIRMIVEYMQTNPIINGSQIKTLFQISAYQSYKLIKDLLGYGIFQRANIDFWDKRKKYYMLANGWDGKLLQVSQTKELTDKLDMHFIKIRMENRFEIDHDGLHFVLDQMHIRYKSNKMNGLWDRTIIYPNISNWTAVEINKKTIILNYKGHILTKNPKATIRDIERFDLESIVVYLSNLGLELENRMIDCTAHFAYLGVVLKPEQLQIYNQFWVDLSKSIPELETDKLNSAIEVLATAQAVKKTRQDLIFRFWSNERRAFFRLITMWETSAINFMELKARAMQIATFAQNYESIRRRLTNGQR